MNAYSISLHFFRYISSKYERIVYLFEKIRLKCQFYP